MIILLTIWTALVALAFECARQFEFPAAVIAWSIASALVCAIGAFLISRQPPGIATLGGRFGFAAVHWGYLAGHGRLTLASAISWLVWLTIGAAIIAIVKFPAHLPVFAAWTGDLLGLFYVVGVMLANASSRISNSLVKVLAMLVGVIAGSAWLWFCAGSDHARAVALVVAGGPPLLVGAIQGFIVAMSLVSGHSRHH